MQRITQSAAGVWDYTDFSAPHVALVYINEMNGVDQIDKAMAHYRLQRKTNRWTQAMFCTLAALDTL